ncbi:MAG: aminotransferase [Firmicutes bacterium]|nr:aminotransferase [Bacillota bacterium]
MSVGDGIEVWSDEEEHPGNIVTGMRVNGRNIHTSNPGDTVIIGSISGKIREGDRVCKTSDKRLNAAARETFTGRGRRKVGLKGKITLKKGTPLTLRISDGDRNEIRVDSGYRDELGIIITNTSPVCCNEEEMLSIDSKENTGGTYKIRKGDRIAQIVLQAVPKMRLKVVESVGNIGTNRGGGFGSTGMR